MKHLAWFTIMVGAACSSGRAAPPAPTPGSAATPAAAATALAAPPAAAPDRLGPIDLDASTLDLAALFPGDTITREGDDLFVHQAGLQGVAGDIAVIATVAGTRLKRLEINAPALASGLGVAVGSTAAQVRAAVPGASCAWGGADRGMLCNGDRAPAYTFVFDVPAWGGDDNPLASAPADAIVGTIVWDPPAGRTLTVRAPAPARVAAAPAAASDDVERCAALLALASPCGVARSAESGFVRVAKRGVSLDAARGRCAKTQPDENTGAPVRVMPSYDDATLMKLAEAWGHGCDAFETALADKSGGWIAEQ
jgi:hypothetical protein